MLKVRAIKKYHDAKGILLGYTIEDISTGQRMDVTKEALKDAVKNNKCEVVNMTLTSDGRLIGKAAPAPKKRENTKANQDIIRLVEVYTNGKNISAAMIDYTRDSSFMKTASQLAEVQTGFSLDVGHEVANNIKISGYYHNIVMKDGKVDFVASGIKKKSFKNIKNKLHNILEANWKKPDFVVAKEEEKYNYTITIANADDKLLDNDMLIQTVFALVTDAMYTAKIKVLYYNEDTIVVYCMTGIADVRKALKLV